MANKGRINEESIINIQFIKVIKKLNFDENNINMNIMTKNQ